MNSHDRCCCLIVKVGGLWFNFLFKLEDARTLGPLTRLVFRIYTHYIASIIHTFSSHNRSLPWKIAQISYHMNMNTRAAGRLYYGNGRTLHTVQWDSEIRCGTNC
jgi:hypothetical protein